MNASRLFQASCVALIATAMFTRMMMLIHHWVTNPERAKSSNAATNTTAPACISLLATVSK